MKKEPATADQAFPNPKVPTHIVVPAKLFDAIVRVIVSRPWAEVGELMDQIRQQSKAIVQDDQQLGAQVDKPNGAAREPDQLVQ